MIELLSSVLKTRELLADFAEPFAVQIDWKDAFSLARTCDHNAYRINRAMLSPIRILLYWLAASR